MADDLDKENLETFEFGDDDDFNDFNNQQSLGSAIQNNVALKIGIIAAAVVFIIGGFLLFGGSGSQDQDSSSVGTGGSALKEAPTTNEVTDSYKEALDEFNEAGYEEAATSDTSFIPVPSGPATNTGIIVPEDETMQDDPLERWRLLQEERAQQQREQLARNAQSVDPNEISAEEQRRQEAVQNLAQSMVQSMQELSNKKTARSMVVENVIEDDEEYYEELIEDEHQDEIDRLDRRQELLEKRADLAEIDPDMQIDDSVPPADVLVTPGKIEYAQMLIQANSDIPGPVLAQIVTGPLNGARLIGAFSVEQDQYLVINFSTAVLGEKSYQINAVAVDPETNLTGVVTEVDNRYFKRLILPVAAEFITGLAGAIAETQTNTTVLGDVVVVDNNDLDTDEEVAQAIEDSGEEISDFIDEEADKTRVMVKVAAGTPIGVLFVDPVLDCPEGYVCSNDIANAE